MIYCPMIYLPAKFTLVQYGQKTHFCFELNNIAIWFPNWGTRCGGFKVEVKLNALLAFYYSYTSIYKCYEIVHSRIHYVGVPLVSFYLSWWISHDEPRYFKRIYTNIKKRCILFRNRDNQLDVYENIACPHTCYLWNHLNLNWTISTTISYVHYTWCNNSCSVI